MSLSATTLGLAGLAGLLTTLSPCVLPVLPLVVSSATGRSRWGLVTLAVGLALSFTAIGVVVTGGRSRGGPNRARADDVDSETAAVLGPLYRACHVHPMK